MQMGHKQYKVIKGTIKELEQSLNNGAEIHLFSGWIFIIKIKSS